MFAFNKLKRVLQNNFVARLVCGIFLTQRQFIANEVRRIIEKKIQVASKESCAN